jgi:hypothetical protein
MITEGLAQKNVAAGRATISFDGHCSLTQKLKSHLGVQPHGAVSGLTSA